MVLTEYTFLVLEGQKELLDHAQMVELVQRNMKRTEEICTKATVRSSYQRSSYQRSSPMSATTKSKRKKISNQTEESPPSKDVPESSYQAQNATQVAAEAEYQDCDTTTSESICSTAEQTQHAGCNYGEPSVTALSPSTHQHTEAPSATSYNLRPLSCQRDAQSSIDAVPTFPEDSYHGGNFLTPYANSYCDLYPVRMSGHAHSPYKEYHHHHHQQQLHQNQSHLGYGPIVSTVDAAGYPSYTAGYEFAPLPGNQHAYAHSRMDAAAEAHGCFMRAPEPQLTDGHRHGYLRFNSNYEEFVGNQTLHAGTGVWVAPSTPSCALEAPGSGFLSYPPGEELPGNALVSPAVDASGARFTEAVHGSGVPASHHQHVAYEQTSVDDYPMMGRVIYQRGNSSYTQQRSSYTAPYR